jgi:addiction module HigA family antidote
MTAEILEPDYKNMETPLPSPGEMLVEGFLRPMGLSQSAFARHIGVDACVISAIATGKRSLTLDMAFKFAAALGTSPEMWLSMQTLHDLTKAYIEKRDKRIAGKITQLEPAY